MPQLRLLRHHDCRCEEHQSQDQCSIGPSYDHHALVFGDTYRADARRRSAQRGGVRSIGWLGGNSALTDAFQLNDWDHPTGAGLIFLKCRQDFADLLVQVASIFALGNDGVCHKALAVLFDHDLRGFY